MYVCINLMCLKILYALQDVISITQILSSILCSKSELLIHTLTCMTSSPFCINHCMPYNKKHYLKEKSLANSLMDIEEIPEI